MINIEEMKNITKNVCPAPISMENAFKFMIIGFAAFCDCLSQDIYEVDYLRYKVKDKFYSNHINNAFDLIFATSSLSDVFLKNFLKNIRLDSITKENWKDFIEYLIQDILINKYMKELETPEFLNRLSLAILNPNEGTFYDGTAGIGSTITAAKNYGNNLKIYAQEINTLYHAIMLIRAYIHNIDCDNILSGDTLTDPKFYNEGRLDTFDFSIMFPPIGTTRKDCIDIIRNDPYMRFDYIHYPSSSPEWLFALHQYASLNSCGKGITILPSGCLFNEAMQDVRYRLIREGAIDCIISLPPNMLSYTKIPLHLLVFNKEQQRRANFNILFIRAEDLFVQYKTDYKKGSDNILNEIIKIYNSREEISGISKVVPISKIENTVLLPSRYIQKHIEVDKIGKVSVNEPNDDDWISLKHIGEFYRGVNVSVASKGTRLSKQKIINYTDVQNGELYIDNIQEYPISLSAANEKNTVKPGDLLISCKGTAIKICVVPEHNEKLILSANFIGIHIDNSRYDPYFIKYYLESPAGQSFLLKRQVGTSIFTLAVRDLENLPIPLISYENQKKYLNKLKLTENIIYKQIEDLYTQAAQAKWDFYMEIGLGKIMTKENNSYDF